MAMRLCLLYVYFFKMKPTYIVLLLSSLAFAQTKDIITITGDLTQDGIEEKVTVWEPGETGEFGNIRQLDIFKKDGEEWKLFYTSKTAVLPSDAGGMMGDPFFDKGIEINDGVLEIYHFGGSSWKWHYTHKYRFQNKEFELIGFETYYGKLCEYFFTFDYNLSTGQAVYKKEVERCNDQNIAVGSKKYVESFTKKLKTKPTLKTINTADLFIVTEKYQEKVYFSSVF